VLIALGFIKENHSEQALIGFIFLFLLSIEILSGSVQYVSGNNSTSYATFEIVNDTANMTAIHTIDVDNLVSFNDSLSHRLGYYLAVGSFVGLIGVIISLRRGMKEQ
jgi:hypothetical protein